MDEIEVERDVLVPMRDGARLATDVYRPAGGGPAPALVARLPYGKGEPSNLATPLYDALAFARAGYAVVMQDCRGTGGSEGAFDPMFQEAADGADALAWVARQPWCDGRIGMFGGSYLGSAQWLAAGEAPAGLLAMAPAITWAGLYEEMQYSGGAKALHGLGWSLMMAEGQLRRQGDSGAAAALAALAPGAERRLPLTDLPALRPGAPYYFDWLAHPAPDPYWRRADMGARYGRIAAPALNIGGWYDAFLWGTLRNYTAMRAGGGGEAARRHQRLIVGPWTHGEYSGRFPERDFGPRASAAAAGLADAHMRWFDRWLRGNDTGEEPRVLIFMMGADEWRALDDWPPPGARATQLFLHSGGRANTLAGDGLLAPEPPGEQPADAFRYDPSDPAPTIGGQVLPFGPEGWGPRDQRAAEERDDVLVYSTPPLARPVEVAGHIALTLFASASAPDADVTGKLVDVFPDGRAIILTEGILRARYREGLASPRPLEPGAVYELRLDLWATANVFLPGHRIRLEVSGGSFPRFARNSHSGGEIAGEGPDAYAPAALRIFHDRARPSHLTLPVVE